MNPNQLTPSDHDKIGTLVSDVGYLKVGQDRIEKSQEKFHDEIKATLRDLKDGFISRIEFNDHTKKDDDHETRIRKIEQFNDTLRGKMWGIGIMSGFVFGMLSLVAQYLIQQLK